jgi:cullin 1
VVNVFQAAILILYNENDQLTFQELIDRLQIDQKDLNEALVKLCNPKVKLLMKEVNKPVFAPGEKIKINEKFESNNVRVNLVPQPSTAKMATEGTGGVKVTDVDAEVIKERGMIIDATCVRIMKSRKVEGHNELVQAIIH